MGGFPARVLPYPGNLQAFQHQLFRMRSFLQAAGGGGSAYYVDSANGGDGANDGQSQGTAFASITYALTKLAAGDTLYVMPGAYVESPVIPAALNGITIVGLGGRGSAFIEPSAAGAEGLQVLASDVTLVNLGVAGDDTGDYALNIKGNSAGHYGRRFRAYGCKFELADGAGPAVLINGDADYQAADILLEDCEFAYAGFGIQFDDSGYGYPTQVFVSNCRFHNIATACIGEATGGGVTNLEVTNCIFDNLEDGTPPTDYVKVDRAGDTGIFSGNKFATATNATGVLTIAAGIMWVVNATEAGWSAARPS